MIVLFLILTILIFIIGAGYVFDNKIMMGVGGGLLVLVVLAFLGLSLFATHGVDTSRSVSFPGTADTVH